MYKQQNTRRRGLKNKTGPNAGGRIQSVSNRSRVNRNYGNQQQFSLQDVSKLKQLCTVTHEWIQQKSSELLDVLKHSDNLGGDSQRTVTVQSQMRSRNYNKEDFRWNRNSSEGPNFDHGNLNESYPANIHYEQQNRERGSQQDRPWGCGTADIPMRNNQSVSNNNLALVIEKLKLYGSSKPFTHNNASKYFVEAVQAAGTSYTLDYKYTDTNRHRFNLLVGSMVLGVGKSFAKKKARMEAYFNALKRLKVYSVAELIENGFSDNPDKMNKLSHQANIERDDDRPLSALVILETQKTSTRREKNAMSILRRSVYFSKMDLNKLISMFGNMHKVTIFVQNQPIGIGVGASVTKASLNAAADALFNNLYRNNPVLQTLDEEDCKKWIHWRKVKLLAKEVDTINGFPVTAERDISIEAYATVFQKLIDTHPWSEVQNELLFGPGMIDECVKVLYSIAKDRNLTFEGRRNRRLGTYYIIQRYYDPLEIVRCLKKNGGHKGKYRLVPKVEVFEIRCDHWEPTIKDSKPEEEPKIQSTSSNKPGVSHFPRMESDRNFDNSSSLVGKAYNNGTFNSQPKMAINDDQEFVQMSKLKEKEYFLSNNNDGRFDQKFTQDREMFGFNDGEFRQMSRSGSEYRQMSRSGGEFRPMSDSCDREPKQMPRADDRGYGQMRQSDDRGYGQMRLPDEGRLGEMRQHEDRGVGQMRQSDEGRFGQMRQSDEGRFGQMRQSDEGQFGQMRQSDEGRFGQMRQHDDRGVGQMRQPDEERFAQMRQPDNRGFEQMHQRDDRGFEQMRQPDEGRFAQMRQTNSEEFGQVRWRDNKEFELMHRRDEVESGQMRRPNYEESNQASWQDRQEHKQTFWPQDKEMNKMPGSYDREFEEHGHMKRGMSDNFDREFSRDMNKSLGHDERGFNTNYGYTGRDFNQISDAERKFNSQFQKQVPDVNKERFSLNPYENNFDKLSGKSNIRADHSSNYDRRFNESIDFNKQVSEPNRHFDQLLQQKRKHEQVSCDDSRLSQGPNYDDRRLMFNNDQLPRMDPPKNQRNRDGPIDTNRMQNNAPWDKMQDQRGDGRVRAGNSRMFPPNTQMPCEPPQENRMAMNPAANKNQMNALRFLTKEIANTALHVNVKSILANAKRLSNIARARSQMEKSTNNNAVFKVKRRGVEANKLQKRTVPANQRKTAPSILRVSATSKVTKKTTVTPFALNKPINKRVSSQSKNAKEGKTVQKKN